MLRFILTLVAWTAILTGIGCGASGTEERAVPVATPEDDGKSWMDDALEGPRGLVESEGGASSGYVLFSPFASDVTYLVNLDGAVVHTWKHALVGDALYLQDDGSLIRLARIPEPPRLSGRGAAGSLQRISWDSEILWEWRMGDEKRMLHHDIKPLPNGNILAIAWEHKTFDEARAAGRRVELVPEQGVFAEWILEVKPQPPNDARIVWEWHVWDHLVQNHDEDAANYGSPHENPRRLDINADAGPAEMDPAELEQLKALGYVAETADEETVESDFLHMNAIDYHPALDQIAVSVPELGEVWVLDHSTSTREARGTSGGRNGRGGDFLYRWGNPRTYGRGDEADQELFYQHQVLWIPAGWPSAGNLTVFNNGGDRNWSSVVEWKPPLDAAGAYPLEEGEPWGPEEPVWEYADPERFYAPFVSGAHRLAGGNTFVCEGPEGRFFEITPAGEVVWEYRNPFHGDVPGWRPGESGGMIYGAYRAIKIPPDHPGLAGRTLRPLDPQPPVYLPPPAVSGEAEP